MGIVLSILALSVIFAILVRRYLSRKSDLAQLDMLGTWSDVTKLQVVVRKTDVLTSVMEAFTGSHVDISQKEMLTDVNVLLNRTVNCYYRNVKVTTRICEPTSVQLTRRVLNEIKTARAVSHENVLTIQGLCVGPDRVAVMYTFCSKGSLFVSLRRKVNRSRLL